MELHQHTCSDMYILDAFKDAGRIVGELRKRGLFRKVVLIIRPEHEELFDIQIAEKQSWYIWNIF